MGKFAKHGALVGALLVSCLTAIAHAEPSVTAAAARSADFPTSDTFRVEVRGVIEPRCGLSFGADRVQFDLGTLNDSPDGTTASGARRLAFHIDCNHPFTYRLAAEHGALRNDTQDNADANFRREVAYRANIAAPGARAMQGRCDQAALRGGGACSFAVENTVTRGAGALEIAWDRDARPLLHGEYSDRLRIVITPNLTGGE